MARDAGPPKGAREDPMQRRTTVSSRNREKLVGVAAGGLLLIFLIQAFAESRRMSPTSDEPPHIAAGLSYVETRSFRANPQHPPLMKELAGLSLSLGGIHWPRTPEAERLIHGELAPGEQPEWAIGRDLIAQGGPDRVMAWARAPMLLVAALLGAMVFVWGRRIVGAWAALCALLLYTMDPTILAHSCLVTTDIGVSAGLLALTLALWNYVRRPSGIRGVGCGLALGAALAAKFSAVLLLALLPVLLAAARIWPESGGEPPPGGPDRPCPCGSGRKYKACHGAAGDRKASRAVGSPPEARGLRRVASAALPFLAMLAIAVGVVQACYLFSAEPLAYLHGLARVNADHIKDYPTYFAGKLHPRFLTYFLLAWLLKEPLATILAAAVGLAALLRSRTIPLLGKVFLLLPPATMFLGASIGAEEIGVRYILPVFPFVHLLGGLGLVTLWRMRRKGGRVAAVTLGAWAVLAAAGVYPDHLPYFNESACLLRDPGQVGLDGGTRCGTLWLDDSNVDWGQSLKQLKAWLDERAPGRTIYLANYFGLPAEAYGIRSIPLDTGDLAAGPRPGLSAVSGHLVARIPPYPGASDWMRRMKPVALVGHSIYIFDTAAEQRPAAR
jgi:hypothetical protein